MDIEDEDPSVNISSSAAAAALEDNDIDEGFQSLFDTVGVSMTEPQSVSDVLMKMNDKIAFLYTKKYNGENVVREKNLIIYLDKTIPRNKFTKNTQYGVSGGNTYRLGDYIKHFLERKGMLKEEVMEGGRRVRRTRRSKSRSNHRSNRKSKKAASKSRKHRRSSKR